MNRSKVISLILAAVLIIGYIIFMLVYNHDTNTAPQITFDQQSITVSAGASEKKLLKGVTASDKEDGDLTDGIIIDSMSPFNSNEERTITYVVFDSDNQSATASRTVKYTNYKAPKITMSDSLIQTSLSSTKINKMFGATSVVDGDIASQVDVKMGTFDDNKLPLTVTVTDSTGTSSELNLIYEYDDGNYTADIQLKKYIIYTKKGKKAKLRKNVKAVMIGNSESAYLKDYLTINDKDVDYDKKGTYDVYYSLKKDATETAKCKAVVVVQ